MPRRQILSIEEKENLLVIPDDDIILTRISFLSDQDISLINKHRKSENRFGFAIMLCYLRGPGFLPDTQHPPHGGIASRVSMRLSLSSDLWGKYAEREETRWEHLAELYRYLGLNPFNKQRKQDCINHLLPHAMRTERAFLLAEEMLEWLHNNHIIFPTIEVIERTLAETTTLADKAVFSSLTTSLTQKHRDALDNLLVSEGGRPSRLAWLLQPPGTANGKSVLRHIDRLTTIQNIALPKGIERSVHQNRLLKLAREGKKMSSRDLAKFSAKRRYATLVCVLEEARATLTDEIIELHERILGSIFSKAKYSQAERLQQSGKLIRNKLRQYISVGEALLNARQSGQDPYEAIEDILPWEAFVTSIEETQSLAKRDNYDPLHLIIDKYSTLRKYAPRMLSTLHFSAAPCAVQLKSALDVLTHMYRKQLRKVPASAPLDFIPENWRKLVMTPSGVDRKYYEFCVLNELKGALRSGDIWVSGSRRYKNFDDYLTPYQDFEKARDNEQLPLSVSTNFHEYYQSRIALLSSRLKEVNTLAMIGELPDVEVSDRGLKVTPLDNSVPPEVSSYADLVYGMLPHPKITEILDEVDRWTSFTDHFTHLKNRHGKPRNKKLLMTTILADGINLGLSKMAESCPGTTKTSLEGIQAWYIRDETYSSALAELVNAQKKCPLATFWGDGSTSSSDGQNFRVGNHGRYAGQVNLKYGQEPGVQIYTHISDQYSPFFTKVISRVRDSTHVLDGLLYHESDLEIAEHYTDTAGFTEHVFALMHLLGFAFAPRIRDLHDKRLYIEGKPEQYPGLKSIISPTSLKPKDIEPHWDEVLRLATSIRQGTVTASLMMKKLASYPKQNGLAKALREIGRLERTLFMLDWLRDPALRRRVQAGLNKGESRNALARAVFMHRLGEIRDRRLENQSYRASGLTLLTAAITLWNTVYIERAIEALKRKGIEADGDLIAHLSPLGWEHINLSGDYIWRTNTKLSPKRFRSLRPVDLKSYKK
ncbi:Tn3 family transposase, partial [Vibrio parahaemolyticus]|nr:Tn3 family transposase [Vibrio parahaemolyticus]HAV1338186.1 Tn3 family transposase [Vibrio parahaemolyticus]HAV1421473.1 Tn3 family transposase [Vibrio parahaemolyticus]HAV1545698.1 Tn3 family transposase [Vibrio parahaemolyticus]HAV1565226.1 Tn3 family transposase [Vibrio parahaemolyticus]